MNSRICLFLLVGLLGAILAGCGGDEPAPAPPPPPPPPPPAFVPVDVSIELGTSGETLTLQTTESGGFTRNGEAFASGTTVEAAGNTYRLVLADGEWAAEYVAPRPWVTALGRSGDAVLITLAENGSYEVGEGDDKTIFASGGTLTASNGNQYRMTLNAETNAWEVEYLPPDPTPVLLGTSGATVLVHRTEGGTYTVNDLPVVDGSNVPGHSNYRLSMQDGVWTATFVPPPPVMVALGDSGQTVTLQVREDGQFEKDGQLYPSGSRETVEGFTYRLEFQNGMWTAVAEQRAIMVTLGMSGRTVTILEHPDGRFTNADGQTYPSGSTETVGGRTYRLEFRDGTWRAEFVEPVIVVPLGQSGEFVTLMLQEDGSFERDGREFQSNTIVHAGEDRYRLVLRDGEWQARFEAPAEVVVRLGQSGVSLTLVRQEGGTYTRDGEIFRPNTVVPAGGNNYRVVFQNGEWSARYEAERIPVLGVGDDLIILFRQEDGSVTYNNETIESDDIIQVGSTNYQLTYLSSQDRWVAERTSGATPGSVRVNLPNGETITLTRTSSGTYTYDNRLVSSGSRITVGDTSYRLSESDGSWTATAITTTTPGNPGSVEGPTEFDELDAFTEDSTRFNIAPDQTGNDLTDDSLDNDYTGGGDNTVRFVTRGETDLKHRGTKVVPMKLEGLTGANYARHEFSVYQLLRQNPSETETRTFVQVARAKLEEIIEVISSNKPRYLTEAAIADDEIRGSDDLDKDALWNQARNAVGRIFHINLADSGSDGMNARNILGDDTPWSGRSVVGEDDVDAVIEALQDAVEVLSDVNRFDQEFDDLIDSESTGYDAQDYFDGVMSRVRFGSTANTRFGAYAVKKATLNAADSDRNADDWNSGVFFYTPSDRPSPGDIPERGSATYSGETVAVTLVDPTTAANDDRQQLYAGEIRLVANFTRKRVEGTITKLTDESGDAFAYDAGFGTEAVREISLPDATHTTGTNPLGYYDATTANATVFFVDTSLRSRTETTSTSEFKVQLIEDYQEALGVWKAFGLEGSFGADRGATPRTDLPNELDTTGGKAIATTIRTLTADAVADSTGGVISADDEDGTFRLLLTQLGLTLNDPPRDTNNRIDPIPPLTREDLDTAFRTTATTSATAVTWKLTDLYRGRGSVRNVEARTFKDQAISQLSSVINTLTTDLDNTPGNASTKVTSILSEYFGITGITVATADGDDSDPHIYNDTRSDVGKVRTALGSLSSFRNAITASDGIFSALKDGTWDDEERISKALAAKRLDFALRFAKSKYTRFGVWSQIAPTNAGAAGSDLRHGSFAYSPLHVVSETAGTSDYINRATLTFSARYEGDTWAVNEENGDLFSGDFELRVNWASSAIETTITNLRRIHGTGDTYFMHDNKEVNQIFFAGFSVAADWTFGATGSTDNIHVRVNYRNGPSGDVLLGRGIASGVFVVDRTFKDEPVGVLGVWRIPRTTDSDPFKGSFGADLDVSP